jgi:hypothetical protein
MGDLTAMKIDSDLNLVVNVRSDEKGNWLIYGYHTPISRQIFEANYRVLAATKSALASKGVHYQMDAGPRIAGLVLLDEAARDAREIGNVDMDGKPIIDGAIALLADIKRLTMVLVPTDAGWQSRPVDVAISAGQIDAEEWKEVESSIVFFTCHYCLAKKSERQTMARATASVLNGQSTSLSVTEYANSLTTSTKAAALEAKAE